MINFRKPLLVGKSLRHRKLRTIRRLKSGKLCDRILLVTSPSNPENLFDVIEAKVLLFPYFEDKEIYVYGIAGKMSEVNDMLVKLTEEKYADN